MLIALAAIFVLAYAAIALEHPLGVNKSATALIGAALLWTVYATMTGDHALVGHALDESVSSTAQIVFFLIGAMTIVEVVDAHDGFEVITSRISTTDQVRLIWVVGFVTFFLSSILDNLTTTIVMVALIPLCEVISTSCPSPSWSGPWSVPPVILPPVTPPQVSIETSPPALIVAERSPATKALT